MIEVVGDFWAYPADWKFINTNPIINTRNELVMGRGLALEFKTRYPGIETELANIVREYGNHVHWILHKDGVKYFTFPTKHHWRQASSLELIEQSAKETLQWFNLSSKPVTLLFGKPGCGAGGLDWNTVREALQPYFSTDNFVIISSR